MSTTRCPNCWNDLAPGQPCATCAQGQTAASVGALASREYQAAPLPAGPYDVVLGPSEILSATFRMWARDWGRLALLAAIPLAFMVPFVGAGVALAMAIGTDFVNSPAALAGGIGGGIVFLAVITLASLATYGAMIALVDEKERTGNNAISTGQALLLGLSKAGRLLVGCLATGGVMTVGFGAVFGPLLAAEVLEQPIASTLALPGIAVAIAGLWLMLRLSPLWTILVVEDLAIGASFRRAFELTRNQAGTIFVCGLLFGLVSIGLSLAAGVLGLVPLLGLVVQLVANLAMSSLGAVFQLALYAGLVNEQQRGR